MVKEQNDIELGQGCLLAWSASTFISNSAQFERLASFENKNIATGKTQQAIAPFRFFYD